MNPTIAQTKPHFSIPSIIAVASAIVAFFVRPGAGFALAIVAIVFGFVGFLLSFAPSIRGGIVSVLSIILASIGIVVAVLRAIVGHLH
jgi:phage-related protein